jgi:hypothetical protein
LKSWPVTNKVVATEKPQPGPNQSIEGARENFHKPAPFNGESKQSESEKGKYH